MWATVYQIAGTPITKTGKQINVSIHDNMEVIDLQQYRTRNWPPFELKRDGP
jgi:hypothetical protein